jgi:hypothetical protein
VVAAAPAPHPIIQAQGAIPFLLPARPPQPNPAGGTYCIVSLDTTGTGGVRVGGGVLSTSDCNSSAPATAPPEASPSH